MITIVGAVLLAAGLSAAPAPAKQGKPAGEPAAKPAGKPTAKPAGKPATPGSGQPTGTPGSQPAAGKATGESAASKPVEPVAPEDHTEEFDAHMEKARAAVEAKRYDEATAELEAAYRLSRAVRVLLDWAHAERYAERCDRAVFLYDRYLEVLVKEAPDGSEQAARRAESVREDRAKCAEAVAESGVAVLVIPPPVTTAPAVAKAEPAPVAAPPAPVEASPVEDAPPADRRDRARDTAHWKKDPVGWSLFGAGLFSFVGAGSLFTVAHIREPDPMSVTSHSAYRDGVDRSAGMEKGGWAFVGLGSALVVAGIIRLAFVSSRGHRRGRTQAQTPLGTFRF